MLSKTKRTKPNTNSKLIKKKKLKSQLNKKAKVVKEENEDLQSLSVDSFMQGDFNSSDDDNDSYVDSVEEGKSDDQQSDSEGSEIQNSDLDDQSESETEGQDSSKSHVQSLQRLKEIDPEFYQFLNENDKKLLKFNLSDDEQSEVNSDNEQEEDVHVPNEVLEGASDESDYEPEDGTELDKTGRLVTLKMIKEWQAGLRENKKVILATLQSVVQAFHAALVRISIDEPQDQHSQYKVDGSSVFNAVVQLCVLDLQSALRKFLGLGEHTSRMPHKCKKWSKVKGLIKIYLSDLFKLLGGITSANMLTVLLKHLHQMSPFMNSFPTKPLIKCLINLWATSEESVRVLAFLCILRITRNQQATLLDFVVKNMYMTYVKNSKFVSPDTLPGINFMRRSLAEMFALDLNVSYQHVFLYIRQLAIHLRNAISLQKKENLQAVYNWQFVSSLHLWADLIGANYNRPQLQNLCYPLIMVITNVIKLIPTAQYYPLRFHCVDILINLSRETGVFIPTLPYLLEILNSYDFNKKHKKLTVKPIQFTCILRLSKSQMSENGFKDTLIETIYRTILEVLTNSSHSITFPDMVVPCVIQLKQFLKKCTIGNYCKKMRQILEKIEENAKFIEKERSKVTFALSDTQLINGWETTIKNRGTPLSVFYNNWNKINNIQKNKRATNNDEIAEYALPHIKKINKKRTISEGPVELFPSDSEDDNIDFVGDEPLKKRHKRGSKKNKVANTLAIKTQAPRDQDDKDDIVEDMNFSSW